MGLAATHSSLDSRGSGRTHQPFGHNTVGRGDEHVVTAEAGQVSIVVVAKTERRSEGTQRREVPVNNHMASVLSQPTLSAYGYNPESCRSQVDYLASDDTTRFVSTRRKAVKVG